MLLGDNGKKKKRELGRDCPAFMLHGRCDPTLGLHGFIVVRVRPVLAGGPDVIWRLCYFRRTPILKPTVLQPLASDAAVHSAGGTRLEYWSGDE